MEKEYDFILVIASFLIAFLTSFLAIAYASFIVWHKHFKSKLWVYGAAFNMGMGIWLMHFVGMLAMHIDTKISFDVIETALSAIIAVLGSYVAFYVLLDPESTLNKTKKIIAALVLGTSVSAMHYLGMDALNMQPSIQYDLGLVLLSLFVAYGASLVGLEVFIYSSKREKNNVFVMSNLTASIILGSAVAFMHYIGMAAASFDANAYCATTNGIEPGPLAGYIIGIILLILVTSFMFLIHEQGLDTVRAKNELEKVNQNLEQLVQQRTAKIEKTLNDLSSTQDQLIEKEKMAALGSLVAGVAHEVNTPLGIGLTSSSHLQEKVQHLQQLVETKKLTQTAINQFMNDAIETCKIMETNLFKAADLIASFKQLSVDQTSDHNFSFNIYDTLHSSIVSLSHELKKKQIQTDLDCNELLMITSNSGAFSQIFTNLLMNTAIHAFEDSDSSNTVTIQVKESDHHIEIIFSDNGKGMPDEVLKKIFEPFYTTRRGQGGSGLGMHLVYNLAVHKLMGSITVTSAVDEGTTFTVIIPKNIATAEETAAENGNS